MEVTCISSDPNVASVSGTTVTIVSAGTATITASQTGDGNYNAAPGVTQDIIVNKALLTVTALSPDQPINEGFPLPEFAFSYNGFVNGDDVNSVFGSGPGSSTSPLYDGSAGRYNIIFSSTDANYDIQQVQNFDPGHLYVNPYGPGTGKVHPSIDCIKYLGELSEYAYVARFYYHNPNETTVFIPKGINNNVSTAGNFDASALPVWFYPGTSGRFDVFFDGTKLKWFLTSYKTELNAAVSSDASSGSERCSTAKSLTINTSEGEVIEQPAGLVAYPNPVLDKVYISLNNEPVSNDVSIYDIYGRCYIIKASWSHSNGMEVDLSGMSSGLYFIKINTGESFKILRITKQ